MSQPLIYNWSDVVQNLSRDSQWKYAIKYLSKAEQLKGISLQHLWEILDQAWDEVLVNYKDSSDLSKVLYKYYQHPVWLINAAFSESDPGTISDRLAAVRLITHAKPQKILDFGGGIGTVSRLCSIHIPQAKTIDIVDITEFRHTIVQYLSDFPKIRVLEKPEPLYDAVICTEVFEHLIDPIAAIAEINQLLRVGGSFAASWSFAPCIKCHLPQNFHLRRLMPWIIRSLGFGFYGFERRGSTVYSFVKHSEVSKKHLQTARLLEAFSRLPVPINRALQIINVV